MEDFVLKISLLCDILESKKHTLSSILNILENQQAVLYQKEKNNELKNILNLMNDKKQELIDEIFRNDDLFDKVFSSIKNVFEEKSLYNKELIKKLQDGVKAVTDLDVKIRVQELKLNDYIINEQKRLAEFKRIKPEINKANIKYILNQYKINSDKYNHDY